MPYYNRRQLLINTLNSIVYFKDNYPIEVVIVDDGSSEEHQINDIQTLFPQLNINLIVIRRAEGEHRTPTISYNMGFNVARGDIILINCAEGFHAGNIIKFVFNNFELHSYMVFSAYGGTPELNELINKIDWYNFDVQTIYNFIHPAPVKNWLVHSGIGNHIPYSAAINRGDMETLSGYDERFTAGIGFDDYDFTDRIYNLGLKVTCVNNPFCIHQYHDPTIYYHYSNLDLLNFLRTEFPKRIKADHNSVYVRWLSLKKIKYLSK